MTSPTKQEERIKERLNYLKEVVLPYFTEDGFGYHEWERLGIEDKIEKLAEAIQYLLYKTTLTNLQVKKG